MLPFVAKLLMGGQLSFEKGNLSIFGERVLIIPLELILILVRESLEDKKLAKYIYESSKQSVISFCNDIQKKLKVSQKETLDILINLTEMNGYGEITPIKVGYKEKVAIYHLKGLPSKAFFGKIKVKENTTVDVYWCGLVAGGMSFVFNDDIDCLETRCIISGKDTCEVIAAKKPYLKKNYPDAKMYFS
jgi:hypothetical protein